MRKYRRWGCYKCGRIRDRKRHDKNIPNCYCGHKMVAIRRPMPSKSYRVNTVIERIRKFKDRYCVKPRTNVGKVFHPSKETRVAFKLLCKARQKPTLMKRTQEFVKLVCHDCTKDYKDENIKTHVLKIDSLGRITRMRGGIGGVVDVKWVDFVSYDGQYVRAFLAGKHEIHLKKDLPIHKLPGVVLHETLHWIDDMSGINTDGHDSHWDARLEYLAKKFNFKGELV